jgi:hypothetical protein
MHRLTALQAKNTSLAHRWPSVTDHFWMYVARLSTTSMIITDSRLMLPEVSAMYLNCHQSFDNKQANARVRR